MKIGVLSDTHSYMDNTILDFLRDCDQIWHAGDIGSLEVTDQLKTLNKPLLAVYGNIDGQMVRREFPENQIFDCEGLKVWITHIGAFPPKYNTKIKAKLDEIKPDIFVCGHSHILRVIPDRERNLLHINPGAAGQHGFHIMRTILTFEINNQRPANLQVIELGKRGVI